MVISTKSEENRNDVSLNDLRGKRISLKKGEILYKQKDESEGFYLVISGIIRLERQIDDDHIFNSIVKRDSYFGLEEILKPSSRINTAIAEEDSVLFKIHTGESGKKYPEASAYIPSSISNAVFTTPTQSIDDLIKLEEIDSATIIHFCSNRGNLSNAVIFKNFLFEMIENNCNRLIIDLSICKIIDSTFLGTLIASLKKISAAEGRLILVCNNDIFSWLFYMTKMDRVFEVYPTIDEAIKSLTK